MKCRKCLVNAAWLNTVTFPFLCTGQPRAFFEIIYDKMCFEVPSKIFEHWAEVPTQGTEADFLGAVGTEP